MSWFKEWFNTKYYHILYKNRDYREANLFLSNLVKKLDIPSDAHILDLACGKGRHSIFLNGLGFNVEGVDLSEKSIKTAKKYESARLKFATHDMRKIYKENTFDYVFNLFTSFGYFEANEENQQVVNAMHRNLKPGGILVIDFLNAFKVINELVNEEEKKEEGIVFKITRSVEHNLIQKKIQFSDEGKDYSFTESVRALTKKDFEAFFQKAGFKVNAIFGDYELKPFDIHQSDRLIFVCKK